jgi:hypothetical protein
MKEKTALTRSSAKWSAVGIGAASAAYAIYVAITWSRYGRAARPGRQDHDPLLDRFMPVYEIAERHHIRVAAPPAVTLAAARDLDLFHRPLVRAIFKARELLLGAAPDDRPRPRGMLAEAQSLGWVVLDEISDREIVAGAATKPWEANVTFRPIPGTEFAAFQEPNYVKIVWTLRADAIAANASIFRTETRAVATDPVARAKFRRYWAFLSPGVILIRWALLGPLKAEAERRQREAHSDSGQPRRPGFGAAFDLECDDT